MIEDVLRDIGGIGIYGVVSVILFFLFFAGMLVWAFRLNDSYLNSMRGLPLDSESSQATKGDQDHE